MASDLEFVQYVADQARRAVPLTFRKMFGEYALYANGKVVALVCDNRVFLKNTDAGRAVLGGAVQEGLPYPGAKPWLVIDDEIDNRDRLGELLAATERALPMPKPKQRKKGKT